MMMFRPLSLAFALLAATSATASAQARYDMIAAPVLRAQVMVSGDLVRIGDVIDNAGPAAQIAIYRAPDLGTTGAMPVERVLTALRAHQVIGVDTRNIREISITRLARTIESKDIEASIARTLQHRNGLGDAANLTLTFDSDVRDLRLEASNTGAMHAVSTRFDSRNNRYDVTFEIANEATSVATKLRFTGTAIETVEAAVLARGVERNEVIKGSDVVIERRPKAEVGNDLAARDSAVGMQARKTLRVGQALKNADLARPDLVQKDQAVVLIYQAVGLHLTIRGKAMESGTEGDVVSVMNLQSKRIVSGVVVGRGQVSITGPAPRLPEVSDATSSIQSSQAATLVAIAANAASSVSPKAE